MLALIFTGVMPFILLGLYTCEIEETGALGLIGLVIALIGLLPYVGFQFDMAFVWPVLVVSAPELVDLTGPMFRDTRFAFVHFWMGPVYTIGILLFGIAVIRACVFPRLVGVLFTVGMILVSGILFPPFVIRTLGAVLSAPALAWMGVVLWSKVSERSAATGLPGTYSSPVWVADTTSSVASHCSSTPLAVYTRPALEKIYRLECGYATSNSLRPPRAGLSSIW